MPPEQLKTLKDRVEAFQKGRRSREPQLNRWYSTSDDLNALIEDNPDLKGVDLCQDRRKMKSRDKSASLSTSSTSAWCRGRYLNGEADFKASLSDGVLDRDDRALEVNGKKPPDEFMTELRKQNLAKDFYKDEKPPRRSASSRAWKSRTARSSSRGKPNRPQRRIRRPPRKRFPSRSSPPRRTESPRPTRRKRPNHPKPSAPPAAVEKPAPKS